jgi:hypothetical protein
MVLCCWRLHRMQDAANLKVHHHLLAGAVQVCNKTTAAPVRAHSIKLGLYETFPGRIVSFVTDAACELGLCSSGLEMDRMSITRFYFVQFDYMTSIGTN